VPNEHLYSCRLQALNTIMVTQLEAHHAADERVELGCRGPISAQAEGIGLIQSL
jgi:hypothetical protein